MNPYLKLCRDHLVDPRHWVTNIKWRVLCSTSSKEIVFVVGAPRSGTTLLQRMLTVHPKYFSIQGETGLFSYRNYFAKKQYFDLSAEETASLLKESTDVVDFFERAVSTLGHRNEGRIFVEKTPQHVLKLPFIRKHFPEAKIVNLYRDGRDCYCSARNHWTIPQRKTSATFARYWQKCVRGRLKMGDDPALLDVKYEALAADPIQEISRVMSFLGQEFVPQQLDPAELSNDRRSERQVFARLNEPIKPTSCGRWKTDMDEKDLRVFETIATRELSILGYL